MADTYMLGAALAGLIAALCAGGWWRAARAARRCRQACVEDARALADVHALSEIAYDWRWEQDTGFRFTGFEGAVIARDQVPVHRLLGKARWEQPGLVCDAGAMAAHRAQLARHETFLDFEYGVRQPDGSLRWYRTSGRPRFDAAGQFAGYIGFARDETRRRMAELALRESEQRLAAILDALPVAVFVIDAAHRVTVWNSACEALTGLPRAQVLGTDQAWRGFYGSPRRVLADHVLDGAAADAVLPDYPPGLARVGEHGLMAEGLFPAVGGRERGLLVTAVPLTAADGTRLGAIETAQDVSARREAEAWARRSLAELEDAQRLAGVGSLAGYAGAADAVCSAELLRLLDLPAEPRRQPLRTLLRQIRRGDRRSLGRAWRALCAAGSPLALRVRTQGAAPRELALRGRPEAPGADRPGLILTAADVTELEQARRSAQAAQRTFEALFDACPIPIALHDQAGDRIERVNQAWQRLFGFTAAEVEGRGVSELALWDPPGARAQFVQALERDGRASGIEVRHRRREGGRQLCAVSAVAVAQQGARRLIVALVDIAEQRRVQQAALALASELEARVAERSRELEAKHGELDQAMTRLVEAEKLAALGGLVAGVAHELNSPLGNALTLASTLQGEAAAFSAALAAGSVKRSALDNLLAQLTEAATLMERNLRRASELMTHFKQVAADQASEQRRSFDLLDTLQGVLAALGPRLKRSPHRLMLAVPAGLSLDSYPGPLEQVLTNCVNNALLHAFEGREQGVMSLRAGVLDSERIELVFEDDGHGMPPEVLAQAGTPFFTTRAGRGGTGLGLYIMRTLVEERLGGTLAVESKPGQGTRVRVVLPRRAPDTPRQPDARP